MPPALRVLGGLMLAGRGWAGAAVDRWPGSSWPDATPGEVGPDAARLEQARDYVLTGGGAGCVIRHGQRVLAWGDLRRRFDLNWLAECLTLRHGHDLNALMFERVFGPLGITADDLPWRENSYRPKEIEGIPRREFGAGGERQPPSLLDERGWARRASPILR